MVLLGQIWVVGSQTIIVSYVVRNHLKSPILVRLGNPKAAAHVVRPSVLVTVKC